MDKQEFLEKAAALGINTTDSELLAGYVCKACGNPSPAGVGYPSHGKAAWLASHGLSKCACGHSVKP